MRIAMIGQKGIPASFESGGGIERHVETLSEQLVKRGHQVFAYVRPYTNPERRRTWRGVRLITLPTWRRKNLETAIHVFLATLHVLWLDVDIIHYHGVGPATFAWIPRLLKRRAKVVVTFHSRDRMNQKWGVFARLYLAFGEWAACAFPHVTIAVSHGIQLFCKQMFGADAVYVPTGVEVPSLPVGSSFLRSLGLKPDGYFMMLSRLVKVKAHDDAVRAFFRVKTDKKLVIVGDPTYDETEYYASLKALAAKDPRIMIIGARWGEELRELLAHCYGLIHPSHTEGLSLVILEAMALGRFVIMSDIPGNLELVDHSGVAFPVGDVDALADVVQWLASDPEMARIRGARARTVVERLYSWDHFVRRTEHEYKKLLKTYALQPRERP